ncbi:hypothetical protein COCC4DRAFT_143370 [Bipolaris maydis ATCC 48331]|uniref:Zn(2)-C6 fungal-type domain-containing protein n=2 Tax=Cochliobolus heterostrophus TaxID=5016 RepID=M2U1H3_COCH5|nr:uncharacterized protein COCC4DRAFT_143370 [Bipolaris maydis ATCC 48331]EMD87871.1 hypothetical protein COCHEDRAFT_1182913 [Bipolaris maydis C5]KAJ5024162.1 hypothetical protein J3E73DRAFT_398458 [Bipolaris maydis]ENI03385.1 hypothetical protein COCC4DRAFT_143370 [Bipolaris maydis ATCC 48331]KAJ5057556.1 hypothetical protein J3E74DRAFT_276384 [Bipolaris maydis]KAJ6194809.1 hypothetical protein J3E72DRAFT_403531 [Bipolaris maydis]
MARRSPGFVTKQPHSKSRGGCLTCKRKKIKCDEARPKCRYCQQRKFDCEYVQRFSSKTPESSSSHEASPQPLSNEVDFYISSSQSLIPPSNTSIGTFTSLDHYLLQYYETHVWQRFVMWDDPVIKTLHKDVVPKMGISHTFLLYSLLSIAATQSNIQNPSKQVEKQALVYRQKTFESYKTALQRITPDNYEAVLATGTFLLSLVLPLASYTDEEYLDWLFSLLKLSEGLRVLASLRWDHGIEKLSVYPLVRRESRILPPPPIINPATHVPTGTLGATPISPNPPPTYASSHLAGHNGLFLPPLLTSVFENTVSLQDDFGLYVATLLPAFQALSPIFLSLYYYHITEDFGIRISVFPSFLTSEFLHLVRQREPRALVLVAWWFALADLVPQGWWVGETVRRVVAAIGREVQRGDDEVAKMTVCGAERIVQVFESEGGEEAAKSVFDGWRGVRWEVGPMDLAAWETAQLVHLESLFHDITV